MERTTFPFPLAVNSSHHSLYHRFMLGADRSVLAPFPKPYCVGALAGPMRALAQDLNLPRWRKLYHASVPWVAGFGPEHYELGNVPPHRPLPREYCRPVRRYGAFDFVQVADPSVSALALVAGDRRIIERFAGLADDFCARVEAGACSRNPGPSGNRSTGRMLAGQFAEPSNRWLMPFLHVHSRTLNFTSFAEAPGRLDCLDSGALARAGQRAKHGWAERQAEVLSDLGYRAAVREGTAPFLRVDGVCPRLIAAIEAPRIAVLRLLERVLVGDRPPIAGRLCAELPTAVIAAMAEQVEALLARAFTHFKPPKLGIPSEGPWRGAVREHLSHCCPGSLEQLDAAARRARAAPIECPIFPTPQTDPAHWHAPRIESLLAESQQPADPELGAHRAGAGTEAAAPAWLVREFSATLLEVNERNVRFGPDDPLVSLRGILAEIDQLSHGADPGQLRQAGILLGAEFERRARVVSIEEPPAWRPGAAVRAPVASLEELLEQATAPQLVCEREIGGRSL
jgi:TrwC relaxase